MVEAIQNQTAPVVATQEKSPPSLQELYQSAKDLTQDVVGRLGELAELVRAKADTIPDEFAQAFKDVHQGLGDGILSLKKEVGEVLVGLNEIGQAARADNGLIGGPSTVHPNAFRGQIASLQQRLAEMKPETQEEKEAQAELQNLLDQLVPAYEAYLGAGIEYPTSTEGSLRYVNAQGEAISKEEFEGVKADFQEALRNTTQSFVDEAQARIENVFSNAFERFQSAFEGNTL